MTLALLVGIGRSWRMAAKGCWVTGYEAKATRPGGDCPKRKTLSAVARTWELRSSGGAVEAAASPPEFHRVPVV